MDSQQERSEQDITSPFRDSAPRSLEERLGSLDQRQIMIWRAMSPARRLEIAFQAYQLVLEMVRLTERRRHPELSEEELAWRVTRRMQGDPNPGKSPHGDGARKVDREDRVDERGCPCDWL